MHESPEGQQRMHKRARAATTTTGLGTAASTSTTGKSGKNRTASSAATSNGTNPSNTSFQPGAAATGTATRTVPNGPPTRSGFSSVNDSFYSTFSFANQGTGVPLESTAQRGSAVPGASVAAIGSGGTAKSGQGLQVSQGALIGIIAGGSAAGVAMIALVAWCCWKKRKSAKDEAGWWSLDDDPAKGAVKNVGKNGDGRGGVKQSSEAWQSPDSFSTTAGPFMSQALGDKGPQSWDHSNEKQAHQRPQYSNIIHASTLTRDLQAQRDELFAPRTNTRTLTPSPSHSSFQTQQPPRAPFASSSSMRPDTGNYSVNDVITFNEGSRQNAKYPPASSVYPSSHNDYSRAAAATPPPQLAAAVETTSANSRPSGLQRTVEAQNISALSYPPKRPPRPSEVPSAPPSPYNYVKKAERPTSRDEGISDRFMDVMTGKVGREEEDQLEEIREAEIENRRKKRQSVKPTSSGKNRKDTIIGLTDAYAGGGEEEWTQVDPEVSVRQSTLQRGSSKRSQQKGDSPTKSKSPALPIDPNQKQHDALSHTTSRIDSKPLKELESYFGAFAPPGRNPRALSGVSEITNNETSYSYGTRGSVASSNAARPGYSRQQSFGTPGGGNVTASGSQASLSPLVAPQPGRPGAYGEFTNNPISVYSAAGEVSEMSSGSSTGSPAKGRFGAGGLNVSISSGSIGTLAGSTPVARSPLGGAGGDMRAETSRQEEDVFGPAALSHPLASSAKPSLSLASAEQLPYSLSSAEQDILNQLGLATPSSSGERTPDLSLSSLRFEDSDHQSNGSLSSAGLVTPSTPQFPSPPSKAQTVQPEARTRLSPSSPTVELRVPASSKLAVPPSRQDLAADGFVPLDEMSKKLDTQYRSATLSMYNMYD